MKKKTLWKKLTALGLGLVMAASLIACGGEAENGSGGSPSEGESASEANAGQATDKTEVSSGEGEDTDSGETVEISIAIWNADECFKGDAVLSAIEDKLNIKITPMNVTWDDYTQKIQLWASSGSLPDVFVGPFRTTVTYPQWASQGVIKAIPENLDAYPTLKEYLSGQAAEEAKLDGTLYCIPRQTYPGQPYTCLDRIICYRWDLAQKAGIEKEPETWEDFSDMIKAIISQDPDGTGVGGMTASDKNLVGTMLMPYGSMIALDGGAGFKWIKDDDGLYKPAYFSEDSVEGFRFARNLYDDGVIEKDIALTTNQSAEEKFLQGKSAAIIISGGFGNKYEKIARYWNDVHGTEYLDDVKALNLMPDKNGNKAYSAMASYAWSESYINAAVDDIKLDRILKLFDYLLTDEGSFLSVYGPEGDLYDMVDGKVVMHDPNAIVKDTYPSCDALGILARWNPSTYDERFIAPYPPEYVAVDNQLVEQAKQVKIPEYYPECTQILMQLGLDFTINFDEDFLNIMTGEEPVEQMWEELRGEYEAGGLGDVIEQVNEAMAGK